jgi:hypothetical protein
MTSKFAILILSCDKYSDLWKPFFNLFWANWPDCPYKVYLGSNTIKYIDNRVKTILSGDDKDWSSSYTAILKKIPENYLFVWVEDGFIISPIESKKFSEYFSFVQEIKAKHVQIKPLPKPDRLLNEDFGVYEKGIPYRINVVGFWQKKYLQQLLIPGENSWNFEIMGSYRSSFEDGFYCLNRRIFDYLHIVEKGEWISESLDYCQKKKIDLNFKKRKKITLDKIITSKIKSWYFDLIIKINWRYRIKIMNLFRKIIISY